ncbi:hypothetical protein PRUPE_1G586900 [Prunus persica]|uniref:peptidylprolyl isomerase n=1 Tax=Prunus persica TaxID=3760 RepID=A0A251RKJ4_PRUPE|nr:uncharacterized protein LOC18790110 isoform X2 [Prunus persica]ONI36476.1 hypothetical protein PRUPE_1G586900 [Prunus persica]
MTTVVPSHFQSLGLPKFPVRSYCSRALTCQNATRIVEFCNTQRKLFTSPHKTGHARLSRLIYAAGSGLEASIADVEGNLITLKTAKIVIESREDNKIQVRVDLTGDDTEKVFDKVLTNLARTAPPVPGFRRQKGGKTSKVPKSFLLDILGKERVTKFVIQEIISSTMGDYVKKENLNVKENKINTTQTAEELKLLFKPGTEFGFNAILELENSEIETPS